MIKFCPNCGEVLSKNVKYAEGVKSCNTCEGIFFILQTSKSIQQEDK
jgi:DNA-directed RNA polymerase subunit M/transcription elongation factor TFIIS